MHRRLLATLPLLLIAVICTAILTHSRAPLSADAASEHAPGDRDLGFVPKSPLVGELALVRTPDSEFLNQPALDPAADSALPIIAEEEITESDATVAGQEAGNLAAPANADVLVASSGDAKEIRELESSGSDGKDFKEMMDPKSLPPILEGEDVGGGGVGGVSGGGGGGGGGRASEVAAFTETREIEKSTESIVNIPAPEILSRTIIRTVPQAAPVTPVPEPGNAFAGFAIAAIVSAAFLRRQRPRAAA